MKKTNIYDINKKLETELEKLVSEIIAEEFRTEAMEILKNSQPDTVKDFLFFAISDNGNLACSSLDFAKDKNGEKIKTKNFGNIDFLD